MRALVTGVSGFAGDAIARRLRREGMEVVGLHRPSPPGRPAAFERVRAERLASLEGLGVELRQCTLADPQRIRDAIDGAELVFHTAGIHAPGSDPHALGWVNVAGTENVVRAAMHGGARRLIHLSSTDATLSEEPRMGWGEERVPMQPLIDECARTKREAEEFVIGSGGRGAAVDHFETVALRPGLLWGAGDIRGLARLVREGEDGGIRLFGDGRNLIALTHIERLADAALRAALRVEAAGAVLHILDPELRLAGEFFADLSAALELAPPKKDSTPLTWALRAARLRRSLGLHSACPRQILMRAQSCALDQQHARSLLGELIGPPHEQAMAQLKSWAAELGGRATLRELALPPPRREEIAEQLELASADRALD